MTPRSVSGLALLASILAAGSAVAQGFAPLAGRVVDNAQRSVPNLQVRLRPPVNSNVAGQISLTDGNGNFNFPQVQGGKYLLEVSQGPYLLYRQSVAAPMSPLNIIVQRR